MAALEDELTTAASAPGDRHAEAPALRIGRLYEQHYPMIRALCRVLLRNQVDAEDAAQQTFLSAFGSLIDGTVPERPAAWLATIARRECWARSAQRRRQPLVLDEETAPAARDDPLADAIRNIDLAALWRAIDALPRQQRRAFLMREFSGLSYAEVAEALGASESAIESLLVRARRELRDGVTAAVGVANLAATPIVLLHQRIARLLGANRGTVGAATTAGIPVAVKLGVAVAGAIVVGAAGLEAHVVRIGAATPPAGAAVPSGRTVAEQVAGAGALERLLGRSAVLSLFPFARDLRSLGIAVFPSDELAATDPAAGHADGTGDKAVDPGEPLSSTPGEPPSAADAPPTEPTASGPTAADPAPGDATPTEPGANEPPATDPGPAGAGAADPGPTDPGPTEPGGTDPAPTEPEPTDPGSTGTPATGTAVTP